MKRLDIELYKRGLCETRNKAQEFIKKGLVKVNDKVENKSSFLIGDEDKLSIEYPAKMYVSRGGEKLEKALQEFNISVQDRVVIDVGSSTGGFCDCLLQNGASKVLCVDVGSSQLHAKLRNDNRVIAFENTDIRDFDASPYKGKVDIFVGGAPCQAFSIVGEQRGFEDTRGTLFREFARIVKECQPKVFIFENVQGLFKHDNGRTWQVIYNTFCDYCGYDVHYQLLNARDYGIPQTRERLYCVGFKKETKFKYPAPIPLPYRMYDFLEDYSECDFFNKDKNVKFLAGNKERSKLLSEGKVKEEFNDFIFKVDQIADKYYLSEKVAKYVLCPGTKTFKTPIKTDLDIARPLLQSMHKMHRAGVDNYVTYNKEKGIDGLRKLTPRECLRLMGFKDDFKIVVSDTSMYMEAGNSIVVDVLIALLKQMDITKYGVNEE